MRWGKLKYKHRYYPGAFHRRSSRKIKVNSITRELSARWREENNLSENMFFKLFSFPSAQCNFPCYIIIFPFLPRERSEKPEWSIYHKTQHSIVEREKSCNYAIMAPLFAPIFLLPPELQVQLHFTSFKYNFIKWVIVVLENTQFNCCIIINCSYLTEGDCYEAPLLATKVIKALSFFNLGILHGRTVKQLPIDNCPLFW